MQDTGSFAAPAPRGGNVPARMAKRGLDVLVSALCLCLLVPLMLIVGTAIWRADGLSPFARDPVVGRHGRQFLRLRFRTAAADGWAGSVDDHAARLARALRDSSLDEVPTLWNVFLGEMSLVGPRPMSPVAADGSPARPVPTARPGLTGPWKAGAPAGSSGGEADYGATWTVRGDAEILARTLAASLVRRPARRA